MEITFSAKMCPRELQIRLPNLIIFIKMIILNETEVKRILDDNMPQTLDWMKSGLLIDTSNILMPVKSTQIINETTKDRINCMPASLLNYGVGGAKLISVYPSNKSKGYPNVNGTITLVDLNTGRPIAFMGASYLTAVRTAAIGTLASQYLALPHIHSVGFIGAGEQAKMHFRLLKIAHPEIERCYVSADIIKSVSSFIQCFENEFPDVHFVNCGSNFDDAVQEADIVVTATSAQERVLHASAIRPNGVFYIHVGGIEDENDVALMASKIVCDDWESVKHREQTISIMYQQSLLKDEDIYGNLSDIIKGEKPGRENSNEFIYFNSVGLASIDIFFANHIYQEAVNNGIGYEIIM